jgi:carbon starvation protein
VNVGVLLLALLVLLALGYRVYGRWLGRCVGVDPSRPTPARRIDDGVDFVPTKPPVLFGHHFAAIAAAGPIVGPTLALTYGVVPVLLWLAFGVIFIGATHDFVALFLSMREEGRSVPEVARRTLGKLAYLLFVSFALVLCVLVIAAFLDLTSKALTSMYPAAKLGLDAAQGWVETRIERGELMAVLGGIASTSVVFLTASAPLIGWLLYRKNAPVWAVSILAVVLCAVSLLVGFWQPVTMDPRLWIAILAAYILVAAWVPVWLVLQPRDFVNVHFLYAGMAAMVVSLVALGVQGTPISPESLEVTLAPKWLQTETGSLGAASATLWPFLFVTVACGAVSGAHALVAGGTTSKQIANERDAPMIGYGGMLLESVLGICVTLLMVSALSFGEYRALVYPETGGDGNPALAFAVAVGRGLERGIGIDAVYGTLFGILLLEGFLITTIDALARLTRYLLEELWVALFEPRPVPPLLRWKAFNAALPIAAALYLCYGAGYQSIWPAFGSANQLLAALTLTTAWAWLRRRGVRPLFVAIPALIMVVTTLTSLGMLLVRYAEQGNWALTVTDVLLLLLAGGMVAVTVREMRRRPAAGGATHS